jgi:hypothetical protein
VADEDHRDPGRLQLPDHLEQGGHLGLVQRRGRLVHHHQLGVEGDGPGDRHHLLEGDVELAQRPGHVHPDPEALQQLVGLGVHAPAVEQAEAARLAAEEDVLGHGPERHQVDLLVDGADPARLGLLGRVEVDRLGVKGDGAGVAAVGTGQDLDQGRLAGAVLAHDGVDLAPPHHQRGLLQGADPGEGLADPLHAQEGLGGGHGLSRRRRCSPWRWTRRRTGRG